jgi:regulator of protease activity HflC (stomatin/prohibitin superfamily)
MKSGFFKRFQERYLMGITLGAMIIGLMLIFFSPRMLIVIPAGYGGVLFRPLTSGTDLGLALDEGAHLVFPWNQVEQYDLRLQTVEETFNVITRDGLAIEATIVFRYRIAEKYLPLLHKNVGSDYLKVMLTPEVAAHAREVVAKYDAEGFYSLYRAQVQKEILAAVRRGLHDENSYSASGINLVDVDDILIKGIVLPPIVAASIERKVEQYHRLLEFDYRLKTETKEAQRKEIEGEGVHNLFAKIGPNQVSEYLRLAAINANLALAQSPNAKVVVMGGDSRGLPLVLNAEADKPIAKAATPPVQPRAK